MSYVWVATQEDRRWKRMDALAADRRWKSDLREGRAFWWEGRWPGLQLVLFILGATCLALLAIGVIAQFTRN